LAISGAPFVKVTLPLSSFRSELDRVQAVLLHGEIRVELAGERHEWARQVDAPDLLRR